MAESENRNTKYFDVVKTISILFLLSQFISQTYFIRHWFSSVC